nr:adenylate/guanylate cyclase domain-containing protein [Bradyrhizobium sp. AUGA SZCCT0222]
MTGERPERRLAAVLAADVAGYSRLMGLDEEGTLARLKAVRKALVDPAIASHRGRIVKTTGDGMLVEFVSAVDAARCAVEIQKGMAEQNGSVPPNTRIEFRIGIHIGDIIFDDNDIFGDGVNIAARLEGRADAGGVCISDDAYRQVRGKVEIAFDDLGPQALKNIAEPMRAWRVRFGGQGAATLTPVSETSALALPDKPSIAVLPFQNMSGDPEQEYFADGMVEDIITELSRIKGLLVIARNSSFTYKGQSVDIKKVAGELGVRYVLEGSVRRAGNRIRVTAQLIEAQGGGHVWAERYDRDLVDIFDLQDEITRSLVSTIQTEMILLEGSLAERTTTPNLKIWDMAKRAYPQFYGLTRESLTKAGELARAMIAADPTSPEGHRLLSLVDSHLVFMGFTRKPEKLKKEALESIQTALSIVENNEHSNWALGLVLGFLDEKYDQAGAAFKRAIEINPNFSLAYGAYGTVLAYAGRAEESIEKNQYAIRLNPRDPSIFFRYSGLSIAYFILSDFQQSLKWATLSVERKPDWWLARALMAASLVQLDRKNEGLEAAKALLQKAPNISLHALPIEPVRPAAAKKLFYESLGEAGIPA